MFLLKALAILILCALVGLTAYFDRREEPVLGSISFVVLIVYVIVVSYLLSA